MAIADADNNYILKISKTLNAPIEDVFSAWTAPERVAKWFAPGDDHKTVVTALDVQVGGNYCIEMHAPDGDIHIVSGEYVEISKPNRLALTWSWAHEKDAHAMLVTIDLLDQGQQTELTLLHERLPSTESRDLHNEGWTGCLCRLIALVEQP